MNEEKYIKSLFDAARDEQPELSFEETAKTFEDALYPGVAKTAKDWLFNRINLNSVLLVVALGVIFSAAFWGNSDESQPITEATFTTEIADTEIIENSDSLTPITVTVATPNESVEILPKGDQTDIRVEKTEKIVERKNTSNTVDNSAEIVTAKVVFFEEKATIEEVDTSGFDKKIEEPIEIVSIDDLRKKKKRKVKTTSKVSSYSGAKNERQLNRISGHKMSELEKVVGLSLNMEHLDELFKKTTSSFGQLTMITNEVFDHTIKVRHRGKPVIIAPALHSEGFQSIGDFIDVKELRIENDTSFFKFFYDKTIVEVQLSKREGVWYFENSNLDQESDNVSLEEHIIQKVFDIEYLNEIFNPDSIDNQPPLVIFTNGHFSKGINLFFDEKRIDIYFNKKQSKRSFDTPVIDVTKFKLKRKSMNLEFEYGEASVKIKMKKKKSGIWEYRSIHHKDKGKLYSDIRF